MTTSRPQSTALTREYQWDFDENVKLPSQSECDSEMITISAQTVTDLKHRVSKWLKDLGLRDAWVSTIDCLSALLHVYIIRARGLHRAGSGGPAMFTTSVSIRDRLGDTLKHTDFGNLFTTVSCRIDAPAFMSSTEQRPAALKHISAFAYRLREAIRQVDKNYIIPRLQVLSKLEGPLSACSASFRACMPRKFGVRMGSLVTFGADLDFGIPGTAGDGRPRWCRKPWMTAEGSINILPRRGGTQGDADWEILICLPREQMANLLLEWELGQFVESHVHDKDPTIYFRREAQPLGRTPINVQGWYDE